MLQGARDFPPAAELRTMRVAKSGIGGATSSVIVSADTMVRAPVLSHV